MEKYSSAFSGVYSKAVSEMYSQFKQREAHPLEKYIGRLVNHRGRKVEVVGYAEWSDGLRCLLVDASEDEGWGYLSDEDVVFKKCKGYLYVSTNALID